MVWEDAFRNYLLELNKTKSVIVCGDLNVAHKEIDLKNPKTNRKNAGFTDQEREKMSILFRKLLQILSDTSIRIRKMNTVGGVILEIKRKKYRLEN